MPPRCNKKRAPAASVSLQSNNQKFGKAVAAPPSPLQTNPSADTKSGVRGAWQNGIPAALSRVKHATGGGPATASAVTAPTAVITTAVTAAAPTLTPKAIINGRGRGGDSSPNFATINRRDLQPLPLSPFEGTPLGNGSRTPPVSTGVWYPRSGHTSPAGSSHHSERPSPCLRPDTPPNEKLRRQTAIDRVQVRDVRCRLQTEIIPRARDCEATPIMPYAPERRTVPLHFELPIHAYALLVRYYGEIGPEQSFRHDPARAVIVCTQPYELRPPRDVISEVDDIENMVYFTAFLNSYLASGHFCLIPFAVRDIIAAATAGQVDVPTPVWPELSTHFPSAPERIHSIILEYANPLLAWFSVAACAVDPLARALHGRPIQPPLHQHADLPWINPEIALLHTVLIAPISRRNKVLPDGVPDELVRRYYGIPERAPAGRCTGVRDVPCAGDPISPCCVALCCALCCKRHNFPCREHSNQPPSLPPPPPPPLAQS